MCEMLYCYRGGEVTGTGMKKTYEAGICFLVATAAVVAVVVCRHNWTFAVSLATCGVSAWVIVRCRPLYISLPLATLILWAVSLGIPMVTEYRRGEGSLALPQVTPFPVYFPLIMMGLYCCACYAIASVFYAVWSRQDKSGHFRTVIALVSAAQLLLAMMGASVVLNCPHTAVFSSTLGVLFVCLGLGSLHGFLLGKVPAIK
jgi:hypothetical protein